jgi:hypothetical protein
MLFQLLQGDPAKRIGSKAGIDEIKTHHWLRNIPWMELQDQTFESPIKRFVDNFEFNKVVMHDHFSVVMNKRDKALKEKEDKASEIVKNSIYQK